MDQTPECLSKKKHTYGLRSNFLSLRQRENTLEYSSLVYDIITQSWRYRRQRNLEYSLHTLYVTICTPGLSKQNEDSRTLEYISKTHAISVVVRCKLEVIKSSGPLLIPIYTPFIYYIYNNTEAKISEIFRIFWRMNRGWEFEKNI